MKKQKPPVAREEKDLEIQQALLRYTSAVEAPQNAHYPALHILRQIKENRRKTWIRYFATAAACLIVLVIIVLASKMIPDFESPLTYSAASISRRDSSISDVENIEGLKIIKNEEVADVKQFIDKSGELFVVTIEYLFLGDNGMEKLLVVADLKKGLTDFTAYKKYPGDVLKQKSEHKNGEYYTYGYFESDGIEYYMRLISSSNSDLSAYYTLLISPSA